MIDTIILAAKYNNEEIYDALMYPLHGKPAIDYVISNLEDLKRTVVVVNKDNSNLQQYLYKNYPYLKVSVIETEKEKKKFGINSILNSLNRGLSDISEEVSLIRIILGDTVCKIIDLPAKDIILTSTDFDASERWCLVNLSEDNRILNFYDKRKDIDIKGKQAIVGYYQFMNIKFLKEITLKKLKAKCTSISDVLIEYNKFFPMTGIEVDNWYDLGHKSGLVKAQNAFFNSREFNSLYVDVIQGTITKVSTKIQKLEDENYWYTNLPRDIQPLVPRVFSFKKNIDNAVLTMELYGYQALSELFILGNMTLEEWKLILNRLF